MDLDLRGRRVFVSGSTKGIGFAIANAFVGEGAHVTVNGRDEEAVRRAVARLRDRDGVGEVTGIAADVADPEQLAPVLELLDDVDILVNNVGLFQVADFAGITDQDWDRYFRVNVMSGVRLARRALPGMLERNRGRILFIASESGVDVPGDMVHYGVTKAATIALGNGLAKLTRGTRVTVNTVLGGPTYSDGVEHAVEGIALAQGVPAEEMKAAIMAGRPSSLLQRFLEPEEIAHLALFLASPLASATNGAAVRAEGGVLTTTT